jgi:hypothetical protein
VGIGEQGAGSKERGERQGGNLKLETECDEGAWARSGGEAGVVGKWWLVAGGGKGQETVASAQWPVDSGQMTEIRFVSSHMAR